MTRRILIALRETQDETGDRERLAALMAALAAFRGEDEVRLLIRTRDDDDVELALPPARACPELSAAAGDILGEWGEVRVQETATPSPLAAAGPG